MKRLFCFLAIALFVIGISTNAFAAANTTAYGGGTGLNTVKTVTTVNTDGEDYDSTSISSTYFDTGKCLVLGYSGSVIGANSEGLFDIRDAASSTLSTDSYIINESEATLAYPVERTFLAGIRLSRGLTINQGPKTIVTVYYIQDRP